MTSRAIRAAVCAGAVLSGVLPPPAVERASAPPMATPSVSLSRDKFLGGLIDVTYVCRGRGCEVHAELPRDGPRRRSHEELMWTDDHDPPVATTEWKPGQRSHAHGLRAGVSAYVGGHDPARALFEAERAASPLSEDVGAARCPARAAGAAKRGVLGLRRLALAEQAEHNAMVEGTDEEVHAGGQEPQLTAFTWNWTTPAASSTRLSKSP